MTGVQTCALPISSDFAIGAVLGQKRDKLFRAIYYASQTLNEAQLNYTTTEKEMLVVVLVVTNFILTSLVQR